jgi:hypothetical protein
MQARSVLKARKTQNNSTHPQPRHSAELGLVVGAKIRSMSDSSRGNVPSIMLQPRCNYRLYEPNTCRVDPDARAGAARAVRGRDRPIGGDVHQRRLRRSVRSDPHVTPTVA